MNRRMFLAVMAAFGAMGARRPGHAHHRGAGPALEPARPFSAEAMIEAARQRSKAPHRPRPEIPKQWSDLTYDLYRSIWFKPDRAVWHDTDAPLHVDLFHPGLYFPQGVQMHVVERGMARRIVFDMDLFDMTDQVPELPVDGTLGFSGARLRAELEKPGIFSEFAVFQGASYFRGIGRGQTYGLSARGLALNTGDTEGEEFPDFTSFWLERPEAAQTVWTVHAELDSPSVAGFYTFEIETDDVTTMRVSAHLFPRVELDHVGIAPLTSMFLFDGTNRDRFNDFRPAVHDSDGLSIFNGNGEMLWRPLANPKQLQVSSFVDENPRGFGLMQRARRFSDFSDLQALYHNRPCLWIEPGENWGPGVVRLVEIPSDKEIYDNIVAYWRPREPLPKEGEAHLTYSMRWGDEGPELKPVARVLNTQMGLGFNRDNYVVAIDFAAHPAIPENLDEVTLHVSSMSSKTSKGILQRNPETGGPRLNFSFDPGTRRASELRAQLMHDGTPISEVWLYRWTA
ncbi:MAG: glucan biosynthesis protein G [Pseudomonadota bacterium]